jgi:hypothetical protein
MILPGELTLKYTPNPLVEFQRFFQIFSTVGGIPVVLALPEFASGFREHRRLDFATGHG